MHKKTFIDIVVHLPVNKTFIYNVPPILLDQVKFGKRVIVPFGKRIITGSCLGFRETSAYIKEVKDIIDVLDECSIFNERQFKFFQWMASYYFAPIGEVINLIFPSGTNIKSQRHFFATEQDVKEGAEGRGQRVQKINLTDNIFDVIKEKDGSSLASLIKIFKGKSIYSSINKLKQMGFIREELKIKGRSGEKAAGALTKKKVRKDPFEDISPHTISHKPNIEQEKAINAVCNGLRDKTFSPFLLYGVTGSGKTLVYLKTIEQAVAMGRQVIFLVPEIALTLWPVKYLTAMFPNRVALLHSSLSEGERYNEWQRIGMGEVDVVIGARSAIFAPLKKLGLIIVDEEHETAYKQEERVKYNARDLSLMMGKTFNLTVVLGSATPSIETFYNVQNNKITLLTLNKRVDDRPMPVIEIVDMRKSKGQRAEGRGQKIEIISDRLKSLMDKNLSLGYQTILFLNRRGFSNFLICENCGYTFKCLNCSVSLTMHKAIQSTSPYEEDEMIDKEGRGQRAEGRAERDKGKGDGILICHYCNMSIPIPDKCPKCKDGNVKLIGFGTEQIEGEVRRLFQKTRVARMDRDTTRKKRAHQMILDAVDAGKVDVLVGTQMVAKGHHFPNVTLVGILSADTALNLPDFRSQERTFQLINQAAGRAGRGEVSGKVIVQTFTDQNDCLKRAVEQDYKAFFEEELINRNGLSYPPFSRLAILRFEGNKEQEVGKAANKIKGFAEKLLKDKRFMAKDLQPTIIALGPAPAFLSKLRGKYRWQILLKGKDTKILHEFVNGLLAEVEIEGIGRVKLIIDVDPVTTI